jgi:cell division protein ZapA (FtsZ GTPase activity inhibitor)
MAQVQVNAFVGSGPNAEINGSGKGTLAANTQAPSQFNQAALSSALGPRLTTNGSGIGMPATNAQAIDKANAFSDDDFQKFAPHVEQPQPAQQQTFWGTKTHAYPVGNVQQVLPPISFVPGWPTVSIPPGFEAGPPPMQHFPVREAVSAGKGNILPLSALDPRSEEYHKPQAPAVNGEGSPERITFEQQGSGVNNGYHLRLSGNHQDPNDINSHKSSALDPRSKAYHQIRASSSSTPNGTKSHEQQDSKPINRQPSRSMESSQVQTKIDAPAATTSDAREQMMQKQINRLHNELQCAISQQFRYKGEMIGFKIDIMRSLLLEPEELKLLDTLDDQQRKIQEYNRLAQFEARGVVFSVLLKEKMQSLGKANEQGAARMEENNENTMMTWERHEANSRTANNSRNDGRTLGLLEYNRGHQDGFNDAQKKCKEKITNLEAENKTLIQLLNGKDRNEQRGS